MALPTQIQSVIREHVKLGRQPVCANLADVLNLVAPRIGEALLDARGRAALRAAAAPVPVLLAPFWGIEILLGDPAPRADFLFRIDRDDVKLLASPNGGGDSANERVEALRQRSPFWREFGRFAEEWLENPDWVRLLLNVWFEIDTATSPDIAPAESLDRPNLFWGAMGQSTKPGRELLRFLGMLGPRFYGLESAPARVAAVADAIPRGTLIFQMGVMGARSAPTARLCVKNPRTAAYERWLAEIGWPGQMAKLRETFDWLRPLAGEIALNVDILPDGVGDTLGIEIYAPEQTLSVESWRPLCDELLARGLARAEKMAALLDIPWSRRFRQLGVHLLDPPIGFPVVAINLHHLKLIFAAGELTTAKAYVGVYFPSLRHDEMRK